MEWRHVVVEAARQYEYRVSLVTAGRNAVGGTAVAVLEAVRRRPKYGTG